MLKRIFLEETDSTNNYAKRISDETKDDCLIIAKKQTAGRGRTGRSFFSPEGGIYMSLLLHPKAHDRKPERITLMGAVAVCRALETVFAVKPEIKWVNDIFSGGKKVCGILTEGVFNQKNGGLDYAVLGVGVNLCLPEGGFPEEISGIAGAVCETATAQQREEFIDRFVFEFFEIYKNGKDYMDEYKARSMVIGKKIEYIKDGVKVTAEATGITDDGELVVNDENGTSFLRSGEVKICVDSILKTR